MLEARLATVWPCPSSDAWPAAAGAASWCSAWALGQPLEWSVARISSLLKKPAKGATPASASDPTRNVAAVIGMMRLRPPNRRMSITPPIECITEPAPRNRSALKKAWVTRWKIAAVKPSIVPVPRLANM